MAAYNTIKIRQIDTGELLTWLKGILGIDLSGTTTQYNYTQEFEDSIHVIGDLHVSGISYNNSGVFASGITSNGNAIVNGNLQASTISVTSFSVPSISVASINIGSMNLTGVPIYDSGSAVTASLLPSGTIFGIKQRINYPSLEKDSSGNYMPATGLGTVVAMLCVSLGI
jgi:hypothetical protein